MHGHGATTVDCERHRLDLEVQKLIHRDCLGVLVPVLAALGRDYHLLLSGNVERDDAAVQVVALLQPHDRVNELDVNHGTQHVL